MVDIVVEIVPQPDIVVTIGDVSGVSLLYSGKMAQSLPAGATFAYGEVGYIHTDGTVLKAQSDGTAAEANATVICVEAAGITSGSSGLFAGGGFIPGLSGGTAGSLAYLSGTAGAITTTQPATGFPKELGRWDSSTLLHFAPKIEVPRPVSTDNAVQRSDGTGMVPQNSGVIIDDSNNVTGVVALTTTGKTSLGAGNAVNAAFSHNIDTNSGQTGATQALLNLSGSSLGTNTTMRGTSLTLTTDNTTKTVTSMVGHNVSPFTKGAADTVTRIGCYQARQQSVGGTANLGFVYNATTGLPIVSGAYAWINDTTDPENHGGVNTFASTTDATAVGTAGVVNAGGLSNALTLITAKGQGWGVTNTATHNGATTLVQGSTIVQNFTGTTAGEIPTMPAANLWGAGIGVVCIIINSSNQTITPTRAGSDTFQGGGTTSAIVAGAASIFISDGVSVWLKASVS